MTKPNPATPRDNQPIPTDADSVQDSLQRICYLAGSIAIMCESAMCEREEIAEAQLVGVQALARDIGSIADHMSGCAFVGDASAWLGV